MGICANELNDFVISPTLRHLGMESDSAVQLLIGTAAIESGLGFHLNQQRRGAIGIYQITPRMHKMVWDRYLVHHPELASEIRGLASQHEFLENPHAELVTNLAYATAIAFMIYQRKGKTLPQATDINGLALFWHRYYHSKATATVQQFMHAYEQYIVLGKQAA